MKFPEEGVSPAIDGLAQAIHTLVGRPRDEPCRNESRIRR
jgi:hypothetical protein